MLGDVGEPEGHLELVAIEVPQFEGLLHEADIANVHGLRPPLGQPNLHQIDGHDPTGSHPLGGYPPLILVSCPVELLGVPPELLGDHLDGVLAFCEFLVEHELGVVGIPRETLPLHLLVLLAGVRDSDNLGDSILRHLLLGLEIPEVASYTEVDVSSFIFVFRGGDLDVVGRFLAARGEHSLFPGHILWRGWLSTC